MLTEIIRSINAAIGIAFFICYFYQLVYIFIPFIKKEKPHRPVSLHRFAVLISARNEQAVISHLIGSIKNQDYPQDLITIFVCADNCADRTADRAREAGAVVYERNDLDHIGKGWALNFLLSKIDTDYGMDAFDGYFVFDADNLLKSNYITEMNKTFCDGYRVITSYRNSKNYGDNWISAGYGLWFLRESKFLNHSRMLLGTSCSVSGTGFFFSSEVLKKIGNWNFFLLTEDIEFTTYNICEGEIIGYCKDAVVYDEQPTKFIPSWNQRIRWSKGFLQVFGKYGKRLLKGIFCKRIFSCFDMTMVTMPAMVLMSVEILLNFVMGFIQLNQGMTFLSAFTDFFFVLLNKYLLMFFVGALTTITEWKYIRATVFKKILYMFTFPIFLFTYIPIAVAVLFCKVEWKPISHDVGLSVEELESRQFK